MSVAIVGQSRRPLLVAPPGEPFWIAAGVVFSYLRASVIECSCKRVFVGACQVNNRDRGWSQTIDRLFQRARFCVKLVDRGLNDQGA